MAWFDEVYKINKNQLTIAHFTDCHLFANKEGEYFSVNSWRNLTEALNSIAQANVDIVIFGGDLTQDHSEASYALFNQAVNEAGLNCPVFWVPGNHDEISLLNSICDSNMVSSLKRIETSSHIILLLNSKGPTPAGQLSPLHLDEITAVLNHSTKEVIVFCHHHPIEINGYLDKHKLENGDQLLERLSDFKQVKALFHGHVHNEYQFKHQQIDVFGTPATTVQFEKNTEDWQQVDLGPGYRLITLSDSKKIKTKVVWLKEK